MAAPQIQPLLAATAVAAVLAYGLAWHGQHELSHDGMAGAAALCLLLATAVASAVTPKPEVRVPAVVARAPTTPVAAPPRPPLDRRARASPIALQRFLN